MPYEVVEKRLRMVPEGQLDEVLSFIDGILSRSQAIESRGRLFLMRWGFMTTRRKRRRH